MSCKDCKHAIKADVPNYLLCKKLQTTEKTVYVKPNAEICENFKQGENHE